MADTQERLGHFNLEDLPGELFEKGFGYLHDLLFGDEGHFQIELGKLGLAVGTEVLIAEAADNLEVFIVASSHENLLKELR